MAPQPFVEARTLSSSQVAFDYDNSPQQDVLEPIAIIGFALKYPQDAKTPLSFWKMLEEKKCAQTAWPKDRINLEAFYHADDDVKKNAFVPGAHFLSEELGAFDASFFGISAKEAMAIDPQHRFLLETAYHALEDAGIPMESVYGSKTGVYSGSMTDDYKSLITKDVEEIPKYSATGVSMNMIANRLSWFFNFTGPSVNLDSACSSSLMALDVACQGLRTRDSSMALVAGASLILAVEGVLSLMNMNFLSPNGRCYSFDERANGYSRGEGFGVVLIKRLSDAIQDGNAIRAVIRATGSNQDGHTSGVTQPSRDSQARLIRETYSKANLDYNQTRFFEAHGTGTPIGDPIEAAAIGSSFRNARSPQDPLFVGAVKGNIGHLEGGSGIAGLIKTVMVLEKGVIPPNANFEHVNRSIDVDFLNLKFPTDKTPWPVHGLRRASVASFGFGGSNSHAILDDAYHYLKSRNLIARARHCTTEIPPLPEQPSSGHATSESTSYVTRPSFRSTLESYDPSTPTHPMRDDLRNGIVANGDVGNDNCAVNGIIKPTLNGTHHVSTKQATPRVFVWSAAAESGLKRLAENWHEYLSRLEATSLSDEDHYMRDLAHTLAFHRSSLQWKSYAVSSSVSMLVKMKDRMSKPLQSKRQRGIGFVFTGQGAQYNGMGAALMAYPVFRDTLDSFDKELSALGCPWSMLDELSEAETSSRIHEPEYSQPLTTGLQISLYELLRDFNIHPSLVVGHSSGEIAAAYVAGGLSLHSACKVSYYRGLLSNSLKHSDRAAGAMVSVDLSEEEMRNFLRERKAAIQETRLHVGCINSPQNVTVSGHEADIDSLKCELEEQGIPAHKLKTGVAYHSPFMHDISMEYEKCLQDLTKRSNCSQQVQMISSVTGKPIQDLGILSKAAYWVNNMVQPVRLLPALTHVVNRSRHIRKLGTRAENLIYDLVEIGPHPALRRPIKHIIEKSALTSKIAYLYTLSRQQPAVEAILHLAGSLWASGYPVALEKVNKTNITHTSNYRVLTDLPEYPFDHSRTYWYESNMSRHTRLRMNPRLELLGTPIADWNALEPRWRKFFDITETPWIEDHKVNGKIIYPATGMVVMAVEAAKQIAQPGRPIVGYSIKDATFSRPITVDEAVRTEVQLFLRPIKTLSDRNNTSYDYRICIREGNEWQETCRGMIQIHYETSKNELDSDERYTQRQRYYQEKYDRAEASCGRKVETKPMYEHFLQNGLSYGPAFRALDNLAWDGANASLGKIRTFNWTPEQSQHRRQEHVIHPVTLDAAGQLMWVALTKGATKVVVNGAAVTRIRAAWISNTGLAYPESNELRAYSTSALKGLRGTDSSMFALDHLGNVKMVISHMETTSVSGSDAADDSDARPICYSMDWKPELAFLATDKIVSYCQLAADTSEPTDFYRDLTLVVLYLVMKTLKYIQDNCITPTEPHLRKYLAWLRMQADKYESGKATINGLDWVSLIRDETAMNLHVQRMKDTGPEGNLLVTVGRQLPSILEGKSSPLEVMFNNRLAEAHYQGMCEKIPSCRQLWNYLEAHAHKHPTMKIIEVGAGTGSFTGHILGPLLRTEHERDRAKILQYDYTDISESFLEKAREKFANAASFMKFGILNLENDPEEQGYGSGTYDMVIAGWVLHATSSLDITLHNVRRLLKPGGKLILLEITQPDILRSSLAYGTLPGWWLGTEDYRAWSPCISESQWQEVLHKNRFSGIDFALPDYQAECCQESSVIIATADGEELPSPKDARTTVVVNPSSSAQAVVAGRIREHCLRAAHGECEVISIEELSSSVSQKDGTLLFLLELEKPILHNLEESHFYSLRHALSSYSRVIWTTAAEAKSSSYAHVGMIQGFMRVLNTEESRLPFISVALEDHNERPEAWADHITQVLDSTVCTPADKLETEYVERAGTLMIGRVVEANHMNSEVHARTTPTTKIQEFRSSSPLALAVGNPGSLESLHFIDDSRYYTDLQPDDVEIEVKAVGVNFRDLLVVLGKYNADTVGCECSGVVTRIGSNCTTVRPGDRVCAAIVGCIYTYARCHYQLAVKIPDDMSFAQAASLPITGVTAHYSLDTMARLRKGDSILIHSGAGGTGQMAIQIAQSVGCEIFVTVGSQEKRQLIMDTYQIPEDHILYSRDTSFAADIKRLTCDKGVDVVLNSLSGESLAASWESLAPFGRFIELGKADIEANAKLHMAHFANNVSFSAIALDHITASRPRIVRESLLHVLGKVADGSLKIASPLHEFQISDIEKAFRFMQSGTNTGKIVLNVGPTDLVPTLLQHKPSYAFDEKATYLIAGGLGGLGRSATRWMAGRGARNLILLSRSGPKTPAALKLIDELSISGVRVETPTCDVSSAESLSAVLKQCEKMPPIKGCLQATMVLKDSIFQNMTFDDWSTSIRSKVDSTWNLHTLLPTDLDFFIMLSSVAGIAGSPSQANYAAGNTFQDALATHRLSLGLKATSIDLGVMGEVGIVAENEIYARSKEAAADLATIKEREFLALLDYYCDPHLVVDDNKPWNRQPIIGLVTPGQFRAKGMELPDWIERPMFSSLPQDERSATDAAASSGGQEGSAARDFAGEFLAAETRAQAEEIMTAALLQKLSKALAVGKENIDVGRPLHAYGVDSLLAIELRNWFAKVFHADVAVFDITGQRSIEALIGYTVEKRELSVGKTETKAKV